jgi:hypothetical protein
MDSEFETLGMNPVGDGLESLVIRGRGEAIENRNEYAIFIPKIFLLFHRLAEGVGQVPALVDDRIFPAVLLDPG